MLKFLAYICGADITQGGGGGVDLHYVEKFDVVPPTPTFTGQPASAPRLDCSLNRVFPQGYWCEMSGYLCAVEEVSGVMFVGVAKGTQRAWICMRVDFVFV